MHKIHNLSSFTLNEMIVVLGISSIVLAMAFSVLRLTQQHMAGIAAQYTKLTQWRLLEQSLRIDFHSYSDILYDPAGQQLRFAHAKDTAYYTFYEDKIVKARDTFFISISKSHFYYRAKTIDQGAIDAMALYIETASVHKKLFLFKKNDATTVLNLP